MKFKFELRNSLTLRAYMKDSEKTAIARAELFQQLVPLWPCRSEDKRVGTRTVIGGEWLVARANLSIVVVLLVCCSAMTLRAQTETATVSGLITDSQGAIVPGAEVQLQSVVRGTSQTVTTNDAGIYVFANVQPASYQITVRKQGFKQVDLLGMIVNVQDHVEQNFKLQLGSVSESITVQSDALTMNTTDGSVSTVIERHFVENIPLNGRSFQDLISLTPGVLTQTPQIGGSIGDNGDFSVNGQRTESNNYMVDGISANTNPGDGGGSAFGGSSSGSLGAGTALGTTQALLSVDALQEFRVQSSTYSAEYGLTPGGQFSFVTRSGSNSFHGSVFEYLRNDIFDANDWFNDAYGIAKPALRQNDFGGTLGGPIRVPHLYNGQNKTFFFFSYEGLRLDQPTEATPGEYVPSISLRAAAPSALQPILNAFPVPTGPEIQIACDNVTFQCGGHPLGTEVPSGLAPFLQAYSLPSTINSTLLRLDHQINTRTHLFLRAAYTPSSTSNRTLSNLGTFSSNQQTYAAGVDWQLSNSVSNVFRFGYARGVAKLQYILDDFGGAVPIDLSQAVGLIGSAGTSVNPYLSFNGIGSTYLLAGNTENSQRQFNLEDNLTKTVARHSIKIGVSYRRVVSSFVPQSPYVGPDWESPTSVLNNSADFFIYELARAPQIVYNDYALFGQDEWRVTPALTLSLGVRWEVDPAPYSANANKPFPLRGNANDPTTYQLGTPGGGLYSTTWNNFAPRLGAAWQIRKTPGAETVIRGGAGIFYDTGVSGIYDTFQSLGVNAYVTPSNVSLPINPANYNPSFAITPPYQTFIATAPNLKLPYTVQWNTALEQAVGTKQHVTVTYVGASGRRLIKFNFLDAGPLNPDFTYVGLSENALTSNYQALQVQFQRSVSHGLQALASYTWSHSIDYGSEDASYGDVRGNSDFDVRDVLNVALTWDIPWNKGNAFTRMLLGGWGLDGRITARTGFPVTLQGNTFFDPVTRSNQFLGLNRVPGVPVYLYSAQLPGGREINANAFTSAANGMLGDAPRNFVRGFGEEQINMAIRREFPLSEKLKLQFRAEAFNVLNHPNFGYIDPNLSDATFGQATKTLASSLGTVSPLYQQGGARSIQLSLKLLF